MLSQHLIDESSQIQIKFGINEMLDCLNDRYRWPFRYHNNQPSVEVIIENGFKTDSIFSTKDGYLIPELVHKYYDEGYTIIVSKVQTLHKDIRNLAAVVNNFCNCEVNINAYFGKGEKSVSFPSHQHEYAVLVKNVCGISEWVIDGKNEILSDQNVLYFDAFVDHVVTKITKPKFTLTCNLVNG